MLVSSIFSVFFSGEFWMFWSFNRFSSSKFQTKGGTQPSLVSQNLSGMTVACCSQTNPTKPSKTGAERPKTEETGKWGPGFYQRNISTRWQQLETGGPELHEKRGPIMPMKAVYFSHKKGGLGALACHSMFFHDPRGRRSFFSAENLIQICRCEHDFRTWKSPLSRQVSSIIFDPFRCSRKKPESALFGHAKQQKHPLCNIWNKRIQIKKRFYMRWLWCQQCGERTFLIKSASKVKRNRFDFFLCKMSGSSADLVTRFAMDVTERPMTSSKHPMVVEQWTPPRRMNNSTWWWLNQRLWRKNSQHGNLP